MAVIDANWNYEIDLNEYENISNSRFELEIKNLSEVVLKSLDRGFINITEDQDCLALTNDDLKLLTESNKSLKHEIDTKLKKLTQQQTEYENYKVDQKLLKQKVKETHEAFLMARKHYKKCLNIYYSIESRNIETQVIFIQFFTELKKHGENYSVYLLRNTKSKQYTLQSINPTLKPFKEFQRNLQETNDVPGMLCWIREVFIAHKLNNK